MYAIVLLWVVMIVNGVFTGLNATLPFLGVASGIMVVLGLIIVGVFNHFEGGLEAAFFGGMAGAAIVGMWLGYLIHHLHFVS
jgi:hypothetical protein